MSKEKRESECTLQNISGTLEKHMLTDRTMPAFPHDKCMFINRTQTQRGLVVSKDGLRVGVKLLLKTNTAA